jgi:S-adenosylmethionine uptake transporter
VIRLRGDLPGIAAMVGAMLALTINFGIIKLVGAALPLGEVICLRASLAGLMITVVILATGAHRAIRSAFHRTVLWRTLFETLSAVIFFAGVLRMPLANATVILQSLPLVTTAGATLFLRERVRSDRWIAIAVGFFGVIMVTRPGVSDHGFASLFVVTAVMLTATRDLITRSLPVAIPSLLIAAASLLSQAVVGLGIGMFEDWIWPSTTEFVLVLGAASLFVVGLVLLIVALRVAKVSAVAPFRYSGIVWAIAMDYLVWGTVFSPIAAAGALTIILSGVYITYSSRRQSALAADAPALPK